MPLAVADALDRLNPDRGVRFSTTTRSPIVALDRPDYAITGTVRFASHDVTVDGPGVRFAHNVSAAGRRFGTIVLMPEPGTPAEVLSGPGSVTEALSAVCSAVVVVLLPASPVLPAPLAGPAFGSYAPEEVTWLLKDIGDAALEAPTADREAAMQSGGASYAESLPIEYSPSQQYQQLYRDALERSSARVAQAVGTVTEMALAARRNRPVLVSLARAGTPVGILMRRWAQQIHGIDLPHYTMSIVRGVGLDQTALRYLAAHHDPEQILFVDGWTGKGAITRELSAALDRFAETDGVAFPKDLAVLADPGHCAAMYGTREDYLIPSACLNSTVSGLVSRTVFNTEFIGPDDFHGAKFYHQLRGDDVSREFLAAVSVHFPDRRSFARTEARTLLAADRTPTWAGRLAVESIGREYGIDDLNLVKPGVGETTRVLLRRVPWKILVRPDAAPEIAHILLLAQQRGVVVLEVPDLPFSCVGLIDPRFSRGDSGPDGRRTHCGGRPVNSVLVASDLDRTLIFSAKAFFLEVPDHLAPAMVVTELYRGCADLVHDPHRRTAAARTDPDGHLRPVTTRTEAQYRRVRLPGAVPEYAVTTNGGVLLKNGEPDIEWQTTVGQQVSEGSAPLAVIEEFLSREAYRSWILRLRQAEELFLYAIVDRELMPAEFVQELDAGVPRSVGRCPSKAASSTACRNR